MDTNTPSKQLVYHIQGQSHLLWAIVGPFHSIIQKRTIVIMNSLH